MGMGLGIGTEEGLGVGLEEGLGIVRVLSKEILNARSDPPASLNKDADCHYIWSHTKSLN